MNTINKKLMPFRSYDENDVINEFSLDTTGEYGQLVKISRGDLDSVQGDVADSFGADFDRVSSPRWGVKNKITLSASGDTKYDLLGFTLMSTLSHDENDEQLKFYRQKGVELFSVISGEAVPVIGKGRFTLGPQAYTVTGGTPDPTGTDSVQASVGDLVVPSNTENGKVDIVPSSWVDINTGAAFARYQEEQIIGRVLATGNGFGGTVYVSLDI